MVKNSQKFQLLNASQNVSQQDMQLGTIEDSLSDDPKEKQSSVVRQAKFGLGDRVKHRIFSFRGVVMDVDFAFNNTEEWYQSIPHHLRPKKDQPFYHMLAENEDKTVYFAYVSEQNLIHDPNNEDIDMTEINRYFEGSAKEGYRLRSTFH